MENMAGSDWSRRYRGLDLGHVCLQAEGVVQTQASMFLGR